MREKKENGLVNMVKDFFGNISQIFLGSIIPPLLDSTELVMQNIEKRIKIIEKRIIRKISSFLIISFGGIILIFSLIFYLIEYLKWSKSLAYLSIGIILLIIGLILKVKDLLNEKNNG